MEKGGKRLPQVHDRSEHESEGANLEPAVHDFEDEPNGAEGDHDLREGGHRDLPPEPLIFVSVFLVPEIQEENLHSFQEMGDVLEKLHFHDGIQGFKMPPDARVLPPDLALAAVNASYLATVEYFVQKLW